MDNNNDGTPDLSFFDQEAWFSNDLFSDQDVNFQGGVDLSICPDGLDGDAMNVGGNTNLPDTIDYLNGNISVFGTSSSSSSTTNVNVDVMIPQYDRRLSGGPTTSNTDIDAVPPNGGTGSSFGTYKRNVRIQAPSYDERPGIRRKRLKREYAPSSKKALYNGKDKMSNSRNIEQTIPDQWNNIVSSSSSLSDLNRGAHKVMTSDEKVIDCWENALKPENVSIISNTKETFEDNDGENDEDDDYDYDIDDNDSGTTGTGGTIGSNDSHEGRDYKKGHASKVRRMSSENTSVITDDSKELPTTSLKSKAKNREHAKNTRIRKKNYIRTLKETIQQLGEEREIEDRHQRMMLMQIAEKSRIRRRVVQGFLYYRSRNEQDRGKWEAILDENIHFVLPVTPYRGFPSSEIMDTQRHIRGIEAVMRDCNSLHTMFQSIVRRKKHVDPNSPPHVLRYQYYCGNEDTAMGSDAFMCRWMLRTENAVECGALMECYKQGMMRVFFSPQNKLVHVEQLFDVMSFMHQLLRASGSMDFRLLTTQESIAPKHGVNVEEDTTTQASTSSDDLVKLKEQALDLKLKDAPEWLRKDKNLNTSTNYNRNDTRHVGSDIKSDDALSINMQHLGQVAVGGMDPRRSQLGSSHYPPDNYQTHYGQFENAQGVIFNQNVPKISEHDDIRGSYQNDLTKESLKTTSTRVDAAVVTFNSDLFDRDQRVQRKQKRSSSEDSNVTNTEKESDGSSESFEINLECLN